MSGDTDSDAGLSDGIMNKKLNGMAMIKPQFIDRDHKKKVAEKYLTKQAVAEVQKVANDKALIRDTSTDVLNPTNDSTQSCNSEETTEPPKKKAKLKGRNKKRPLDKRPDDKDKICPAILGNRKCAFGNSCKFGHDIKKFVEKKPKAISDKCYLYETFGKCHYGIACLNAAHHTVEGDDNYTQLVDEEKWNNMKDQVQTTNLLQKDAQVKLWKRNYDFRQANKVVKIIEKSEKDKVCDFGEIIIKRPAHHRNIYQSAKSSVHCKDLDQSAKSDSSTTDNPTVCDNEVAASMKSGNLLCDSNCDESETKREQNCIMKNNEVLNKLDVETEHGIIKLRPQERKKVDFKDKLYLAPLTTVGNLPYRRICKRFGADITCSEMATATGLLQGHKSEWALLRRHHTEDLFGAQVCGAFPDTMTKCAQVIMENTDVDFVDINCGCPIDLFYKKGEGCGLLGKTTKLFNIVRSMQTVMDVPLTVKTRTGIFESKMIAHKVIPGLRDIGVSMVTLHGRSREQRYTRLADWDYIHQCSQEAAPMPVFGNGDVLSYEDYNLHREKTGVAGCMIARGALMKPWIFTEIKEQRHWDISANERMDMLRDFTNYGLEHWGSDLQGVQITRRFLLELLSFLYRYIPVGILESVPQRINEKPPYYVGRNDLETLMASANCADWIKISEMLLGPVPDNFQFLPKHKANSYQ